VPWLRESRFGRLVILPFLLNFVGVKDADLVHYHGDDWFVLRRPRATVRTLHGSALREAERATR
jgi:phosphatidylinositol alpha-mannosyltransferase